MLCCVTGVFFIKDHKEYNIPFRICKIAKVSTVHVFTAMIRSEERRLPLMPIGTIAIGKFDRSRTALRIPTVGIR